MPVAVTDHERNATLGVQALSQRLKQFGVLLINRGNPAEKSVMRTDFGQSLVGNPRPARGVSQKRNHVIWPVGSTITHQHKSVIGLETMTVWHNLTSPVS